MNSPHELLPGGHAVDLVQDYLLGTLDADMRALVRTHVAQCDQCAADYEFALRLREKTSGEEELAHFLDGIPMPSLAEARRPAPTHRPRTVPPQRLRWAVSMLAVAAALLLFFNPFGGESGLSEFAQLEALPVRVSRDVPAPGSFDEARQLALRSYRDGDYEAAIAQCRDALQLQARNGELRIYEASALALSGRLLDAAQRLDALARDAAQPVSILREARWQRAQVALLLEDAEAARANLETLFAEDGLRQEEAGDLLRKLSGTE